MTEPQDVAGVREGDVLAGKYRIEKVLGVGGMGVVVAARHLHLDERVAIKFLLPQTLANQEAVARFAREGRAAARIKSEHIARVSDVGTLENGAPYMVMEYLEGGDLSAWVAQRGPLPVEQAVEFVIHACDALAIAHSLGVIHRDLKPANLFVVRNPDGTDSVKVLDFGISKTVGPNATGSDMTRTSAVMGSPLYMSPEQLQSTKDVDARTDVWSLGVVLYELVVGSPPFQAETMPQLVVKIMTGPAPLLREARPDAPPGLEQIVLRCLEKDRGRRFQNVGELAAALAEHAPKRCRTSLERISGVMRTSGMSATALELPPSTDGRAPPSEPPAAAGTAASWERTLAGSGRGRGALLGGALGAVALVAVSVVALRRQPEAAPGVSAGAAAGSTLVSATAPAAPPAANVADAEQVPVAPTATAPAASAAPPAAKAEVASAGTSAMPAPTTTPQIAPRVVAPRLPREPKSKTAAAPPPPPPKKPTESSLIDDRR